MTTTKTNANGRQSKKQAFRGWRSSHQVKEGKKEHDMRSTQCVLSLCRSKTAHKLDTTRQLKWRERDTGTWESSLSSWWHLLWSCRVLRALTHSSPSSSSPSVPAFLVGFVHLSSSYPHTTCDNQLFSTSISWYVCVSLLSCVWEWWPKKCNASYNRTNVKDAFFPSSKREDIVIHAVNSQTRQEKKKLKQKQVTGRREG